MTTHMTWTDPFLPLATQLSLKRQSPTALALVLRDEVAAVASTSAAGITERWDLLVIADWIGPDTRDDLQFVVNELRAIAGTSVLLRISRFLLLRPDEPIAQQLLAQASTGVDAIRTQPPLDILGMQRVRQVLIFRPKIQEPL